MPDEFRYPSDMDVDKETDYFSIKLYRYDHPDFSTSFTVEGLTDPPKSATLVDGWIQLPMPSNIQDSNAVSWGESKLNDLTAAGVAAGGALMDIDFANLKGEKAKNLKDKFEKIGTSLSIENIQTLVKTQLSAEAVNVLGGNVTLDQILARSSGQIVNQNNRLLFNGVTLREFNFSFKLTPRNEKDKVSITNIIRKLKIHMNASNNTADGRNLFIKTPGYFDLQYRKGPDKHPFLPSFKECALKNMAVNYTGENVYATYHDGTPISMIMDLTFQELVPIYAEDYNDEIGTKGVGY